MSENTQVVKMNTAISQWTNSVTDLVVRDFDACGVPFDEYSKQCAMSAMTNIFKLVKDSDKINDLNGLDTSNLREIVGQAASLKLNANAVPRECYFQLRTKKSGDKWIQVVEMGIEGDGNDALLRNYGNDVEKVYPCWIVKEGDEFTYPKRKGIEVEPPTWEEKGLSNKVVRVVYPVKLKDGTVEYLISERESVKVNLIAHIRNNMMNETFGICKDRYKATPEQKKEIKEKKEEILRKVRSCETLEDILSCEEAIPFISAAWIDTPEAMFVRKMRNNAIKKFPKNMNSLASSSLMHMDETYKTSQEEIAENENSQPFEVVADVEAKEEPSFVAEG